MSEYQTEEKASKDFLESGGLVGYTNRQARRIKPMMEKMIGNYQLKQAEATAKAFSESLLAVSQTRQVREAQQVAATRQDAYNQLIKASKEIENKIDSKLKEMEKK